jgi:hypothetical protein
MIIMRAEVEGAFMKRVGEDKLIKLGSVSPGDCKKVDFLGRGIKMVVFCGLDNDCSVLIADPHKKAEAFIFENRNDRKGRRVDTDFKIGVVDEQMLSVVFLKRKYTRGVAVYLNQDDNRDRDNDPQDSIDNKPSEPSLFIA